MPTFNEQKGQGTFQPVLGESGATAPGGPTVPGPALSVAGTAVAGAANVLDLLEPVKPKVDSPEKIQNLSTFDNELAGIVSLQAGQPLPGALIPKAMTEIGETGAGLAQGRVSHNEASIRMAAIVQRYASQDPRNADTYRERAQEMLGFQPTSEILKRQREDEDFARDQQRNTQTALAKVAQENGVVMSDGAGGFDINGMARAGIELNRLDADRELAKEALDAAKARSQIEANLASVRASNASALKSRNDVKQFQLRDAESRFMRSAAGSKLAMQQQSIMEAYQTISTNESISDEEKLAQMQTFGQNIEEFRAVGTLNLQNTAAQNGISNEVLTKELDQFNRGLDTLKTLGDLPAEQLGEAIEFTNQVAVRDFQISAPDAARMAAIVGTQNLRPVADSMYSLNREQIDSGLAAFLIDAVGNNTPSNQVDLRVQPALVKQRKDTLKDMNRRYSDITQGSEQDINVYKDYALDLATTSQALPNHGDRLRANYELTSPSTIENIKSLANAGDAQATEAGVQIRSLNQQTFVETNNRLSEGDTTVNQIAQFAATAGRDKPNAFFPVYNAKSKSVEIWTGREGDASPRPATGRVPPGMARDVKALNRQLDAEVRTREFSGNEAIASATEGQFKQMMVILGDKIRFVNDDGLEAAPDELFSAYSIAPPARDTE